MDFGKTYHGEAANLLRNCYRKVANLLQQNWSNGFWPEHKINGLDGWQSRRHTCSSFLRSLWLLSLWSTVLECLRVRDLHPSSPATQCTVQNSPEIHINDNNRSIDFGLKTTLLFCTMRYHTRSLCLRCIHWTDFVSSDVVRSRMGQPLLSDSVRRRRLSFFGHLCRADTSQDHSSGSSQGKPGWEWFSTICGRSILALWRQSGVLWIDQNGVNSWRWLSLHHYVTCSGDWDYKSYYYLLLLLLLLLLLFDLENEI